MVFVPNKRNWLGNLVTFDFLRKDTILIICKKNQLEKKILKPRTSLEGHDPAKILLIRVAHVQIILKLRNVVSVLSRAWDKETILSPHASWGIQPQTFGFRAPTLCGSDVEHRSAESEGLRFDSSWVFRLFSLTHARDKTKNIFLYFFTELKTYHLS